MKGIPAYKDSYAELSGPKIVKMMRDILPPEAILTTGVGQAPDVVRDPLQGPQAEDLDNLDGPGDDGIRPPRSGRREVRQARRSRGGLRRRRQLRHDRAGPRDRRGGEAPDDLRDHQRQEPGDGRAVAEADVQPALHRHQVPEHPRLREARGGLRRRRARRWARSTSSGRR